VKSIRQSLPLVLGVSALALLGATQACAGTATGTIGVSLTINAACVFSSSAPVAFTAQGVLTAAVNNTGTVSTQCTNTLPYTVSLDQGAGTGATTSTRTMANGAATISYALYRDAARTQNWGKVIGTDTFAGTGNGAVQPLTVYGQVPAQTTPVAGAYADTVNVTITF
jgi:spore coat protein U-like protein